VGQVIATAIRDVQNDSDVTVGTLVGIANSGKPLIMVPGTDDPIEVFTAVRFA